MNKFVRLAILMLTGVCVVSCGREPSEIARAREVLASRSAEDTQYRDYALSVVAGSSAPHARAMMLEAIAGGNRAAAAVAIRGLAGVADDETIAALQVPFQGSGSVKVLAAEHLAEAGDAAAIAWLAEQLGQVGQPLSARAMVALVGTEHEDAVKGTLRGYMWHKDLSIRNEAYRILPELRRPWAVKFLLEGLDKEFGKERVGPIVGLGKAGDATNVDKIVPWIRTQGLVIASIEALGSLGGEEAMKAVRSLLDHESALVRAYASTATWRLGGTDEAEPVLVPLLTDDDTMVRQTVATLLTTCADDKATGWLVQLAGDAEKDVRVEAYRALVARANPSLADQFAVGAQDPDYAVATIALAGLASVGNPSQRAALAAQLESGNPYLEISAAHAILSLVGGG